jgi:hypothetical protein
MDPQIETIDCACVIYGTAYSWKYVDKLYSMLSRHLTPKIRLHVYTEANRIVPEPYIKHELTDWSITNPKQLWWYKMQLFNPAHHSGPLLYFDLDTVIVNNLDWIWQHPTDYFWSIRDFKYLWKPTHTGLNSSVMWWDTKNYQNIWNSFIQQDLRKTMQKYKGDQDYISDVIPENQRRFFDPNNVQSWRWQCLDGGYDFQKKQHLTPGSGTQIAQNTSILVFHGHPKPNQIIDCCIVEHWR